MIDLNMHTFEFKLVNYLNWLQNTTCGELKPYCLYIMFQSYSVLNLNKVQTVDISLHTLVPFRARTTPIISLKII